MTALDSSPYGEDFKDLGPSGTDKAGRATVPTTSLVRDSLVLKVGRSTGLTVARISKVTANCGGMYSNREIKGSAVVVVSDKGNEARDFGRGGDSGSAIFDADGRVVGLLWGGLEPRAKSVSQGQAKSDNVYFVTPIDDVLQDIKDTVRRDLGEADVEIELLW